MSNEPIDRIRLALGIQQQFFPGVFDDLVSDVGSITLDLIQAVAQSAGRGATSVTCPELVSHFVCNYLAGQSPKSILDPWAGVGSLLIPVAETAGSTCPANGVESNPALVGLAEEINAGVKISWTVDDSSAWLQRTNETFDTVVCNPPFGVRTEPTTIDYDHHKIDIRDDLGNIVLLLSCLHLTDNGQCVFIVPPSFISRHRTHSVFNNLESFGLHLDAYIFVQSGVFAPSTMIPTALVVIKRGEGRDVFVGELTKNHERNELLAENLRSRREGNSIGLGKLVQSNEFRGYQTLVADQRVSELSRRIPYSPIAVSEVSTEINRLHPQRNEQFDEIPNSVYLPLIGTKPVSASSAELSIHARHCVQIVLDPERASADYVAGFLNTPLGEAVREQIAVEGSLQRNITRRSVERLLLYLPPLRQQLSTIDAQTKISTLVSELNDLEHQLWNQPQKLENVISGVASINKEDRFTDWLDTLPFPPATILWTYHASGVDEQRRYEHLLHFFEGLAQFFATVLLSGFVNQRDRFDEEMGSLKAALEQEHLSLDRGTFGTWVKVVEKLSKTARSLANGNDEEKLLCQQMFGTTDTQFFRLLFSKKLIHLLHEANASRNRWTGHGGIVSHEEARQRHISISNLLSQVRAVFGQDWERADLVLPKSSRFVQGSFVYSAERLIGTRTPFETVEINISEPMDDGVLYLYSPGTQKALRILPLVRVMPSPRTAHNACYFYNRRERDGIRFVSFHFEQEAEIMDSFEDTARALELFEGRHQP